MKKYWPYYIALLVFCAGIILGSFFDFQISKSIFIDRNDFGVLMSAFGLIPAYAFLSFIGGSLFRISFKHDYKIFIKIIFYILSLVALGCGIYFSAHEMFSYNGLNIDSVETTVLSYVISSVINIGFSVLGFFLSMNLNNKKAWLAILLIGIASIFALVVNINGLKLIMHRPRFRTLQLGIMDLRFHNWWEPCNEYKTFINEYGVLKEEFKSFPSGHAAASLLVSYFLVFITYCIPKLKKYKNAFFLIGFIYCLIMSFSRMLVGAHYLTDVSWGGLLSLIVFWVAFYFIDKYKMLEIEQ
ncbi:MAG: phosphatase PAP2 family protein [Bacilli bacterium]|nr:phosphatase PAP2 family protein [Bacilli bacterium]